MGLPVGVDEAVAQHVAQTEGAAKAKLRLHRKSRGLHEFEPCVGQVVVELGMEQQPDGVFVRTASRSRAANSNSVSGQLE